MGSVGKRDNKQGSFWFDSRDFTPAHDELMVAFHQGYKHIINDLYSGGSVFSDVEVDVLKIGKLVLEPCLDGYPPLFPDAICRVGSLWDHRRNPVSVSKDYNSYSYPSWRILGHCGVEDCGRTTVLTITKFEPLENIQPNSVFWSEYCRGPERTIIFELKPTIDSVGSLIRQVRLYKERWRQSHYGEDALVCVITGNDPQCDSILKDQGFPVGHVVYVDDKAVQFWTS